jgi:hypothetical protein
VKLNLGYDWFDNAWRWWCTFGLTTWGVRR